MGIGPIFRLRFTHQLFAVFTHADFVPRTSQGTTAQGALPRLTDRGGPRGAAPRAARGLRTRPGTEQAQYQGIKGELMSKLKAASSRWPLPPRTTAVLLVIAFLIVVSTALADEGAMLRRNVVRHAGPRDRERAAQRGAVLHRRAEGQRDARHGRGRYCRTTRPGTGEIDDAARAPSSTTPRPATGSGPRRLQHAGRPAPGRAHDRQADRHHVLRRGRARRVRDRRHRGDTPASSRWPRSAASSPRPSTTPSTPRPWPPAACPTPTIASTPSPRCRSTTARPGRSTTSPSPPCGRRSR